MRLVVFLPSCFMLNILMSNFKLFHYSVHITFTIGVFKAKITIASLKYSGDFNNWFAIVK